MQCTGKWKIQKGINNNNNTIVTGETLQVTFQVSETNAKKFRLEKFLYPVELPEIDACYVFSPALYTSYPVQLCPYRFSRLFTYSRKAVTPNSMSL